jgi:hypothetical protein
MFGNLLEIMLGPKPRFIVVKLRKKQGLSQGYILHAHNKDVFKRSLNSLDDKLEAILQGKVTCYVQVFVHADGTFDVIKRCSQDEFVNCYY